MLTLGEFWYGMIRVVKIRTQAFTVCRGFIFKKKIEEFDCAYSVLLVSSTVSLIIYIPVDCRL